MSAFKIKKISGIKWIKHVVKFRGVNNERGFINAGVGPCCVEVYKNREYAAARNLIEPRRTQEKFE